MVNTKTLLPDLKKLVGELAEDLLARATEIAEIDAGLREAFKQIEKGGRTAQAYEVWREDYLDQVAVAWVLACVFVRFMEDNHLIEECWLAGEGDRRKLAEVQTLFHTAFPEEGDYAERIPDLLEHRQERGYDVVLLTAEEEGDRVIGFALAHYYPILHYAYLDYFASDPDRRTLGIGGRQRRARHRAAAEMIELAGVAFQIRLDLTQAPRAAKLRI